MVLIAAGYFALGGFVNALRSRGRSGVRCSIRCANSEDDAVEVDRAAAVCRHEQEEGPGVLLGWPIGGADRPSGAFRGPKSKS